MSSSNNHYPILDRVGAPADLRDLDSQQLHDLADELRTYLIAVTSQTGGHLAPGLGTIELTIALHYVFNTPHDRLVWDIGHQAYPHKNLNRQTQSISDHQAKRWIVWIFEAKRK